jgi:predicted amidophosphoribosyltransferase
MRPNWLRKRQPGNEKTVLLISTPKDDMPLETCPRCGQSLLFIGELFCYDCVSAARDSETQQETVRPFIVGIADTTH